MSRWIDIDDDRNCYIGEHGEYQRWNIDPEVLEEAEPTAPKGNWVEAAETDRGATIYVCSECFYAASDMPIRNFCPSCGADMRGDKDERK